MSTRQSIVTWHPWPQDGARGVPNDCILFLRLKDEVVDEGFAQNGCLRELDGRLTDDETLSEITHYALASDLETVHDIDRAGVTANPSPTKPNLGLKSDEDRVRWLTEQGAKLIKIPPGVDMTFEQVIRKIVRLEEAARNQVEREEGGSHGVA